MCYLTLIHFLNYLYKSDINAKKGIMLENLQYLLISKLLISIPLANKKNLIKKKKYTCPAPKNDNNPVIVRILLPLDS